MRFLISVIDDQTGSATPDEMTAIDACNERLQAEGHWVIACGITSPDLNTARDLAAEGSKACNRRVELRPLLGA